MKTTPVSMAPSPADLADNDLDNRIPSAQPFLSPSYKWILSDADAARISNVVSRGINGNQL